MLGIEGSIQAGTVDRSIYWTKGANVRQRSQDGAPGGERAAAKQMARTKVRMLLTGSDLMRSSIAVSWGAPGAIWYAAWARAPAAAKTFTAAERW